MKRTKTVVAVILLILLWVSNGWSQQINESVKKREKYPADFKRIMAFCKKQLGYSDSEVQNQNYTSAEEIGMIRKDFKNKVIFNFNSMRFVNFTIKRPNEDFGLGIIELNYASPHAAAIVERIFAGTGKRYLTIIAPTIFTSIARHESVYFLFSESPDNKRVNQLFKDIQAYDK